MSPPREASTANSSCSVACEGDLIALPRVLLDNPTRPVPTHCACRRVHFRMWSSSSFAVFDALGVLAIAFDRCCHANNKLLLPCLHVVWPSAPQVRREGVGTGRQARDDQDRRRECTAEVVARLARPRQGTLRWTACNEPDATREKRQAQRLPFASIPTEVTIGVFLERFPFRRLNVGCPVVCVDDAANQVRSAPLAVPRTCTAPR